MSNLLKTGWNACVEASGEVADAWGFDNAYDALAHEPFYVRLDGVPRLVFCGSGLTEDDAIAAAQAVRVAFEKDPAAVWAARWPRGDGKTRKWTEQGWVEV